LEPRNLESQEVRNLDRNLDNSLGTSLDKNLERKKPWDGHDEWVKVGYEVPKRVQMKLNHLKASGRFKNLREFVPGALEAAADAEIARAEEEGY
jgi:hypothetical protein